ncbi:MAG: hypothetical protein A4E30_00753 [Methanomassiliicoccales archaeon PtaB.Bin215]|nr:MAG: hypothetical protein A4E30_00753 [Methanomassiliicoccales archaeon PtaB.Bin215]
MEFWNATVRVSATSPDLEASMLNAFIVVWMSCAVSARSVPAAVEYSMAPARYSWISAAVLDESASQYMASATSVDEYVESLDISRAASPRADIWSAAMPVTAWILLMASSKSL